MRSTCGFAAGGEDEPATLRKLGKRVSAIRFAYLGCRTARVRSRSVQDLSPLDSDLSQLGWRRGSHSGFREGDSRRSDRRPDRAKPQVTRVIGVFDPYRPLVSATGNGPGSISGGSEVMRQKREGRERRASWAAWLGAVIISGLLGLIGPNAARAAEPSGLAPFCPRGVGTSLPLRRVRSADLAERIHLHDHGRCRPGPVPATHPSRRRTERQRQGRVRAPGLHGPDPICRPKRSRWRERSSMSLHRERGSC
jgi:hypothetical protein